MDDNESFVELWCLAGPYFDLDVTGYTDARSALSVFSQDPDHFDLVVTDFQMAHMDGLALARAMRAVRPNVPVILSTGCFEVFPLDIPAVCRAGIAAILPKPFSIIELRSAVTLALESRQKEGTVCAT